MERCLELDAKVLELEAELMKRDDWKQRAEYERSLEESGEEREADVEKGSWEVEDSPEKMCGEEGKAGLKESGNGRKSGKAGLEKGSWEAEDRHSSPEKMYAPIRGADIVARTTVTLAAGEGYEWKGHGLRLQVPADSLEPHFPPVTITIQASLSGHYHLPDHTQLVSGVYWISFPGKFYEPVTLEVQHCACLQSARLQRAQERPPLSFVTAKCTQETPPYNFRPMTGGIFSADSRFGTIELSHFSCFAIVLNRMWRWVRGVWGGGTEVEREEGREMKGKGEKAEQSGVVGDGKQEAGKALQKGKGVEGGGGVGGVGEREDGKISAEKRYAALTYYIPKHSPTTWLVHLPIIWDLDLCMKAVQAHYQDKQAEEGPGVKVTVSGSQIAVDIPEAGLKLPSGWSLEPLVTPLLTRATIDSYNEGQKIPCFELELDWEGEGRWAKKLSHVLHFTGVEPQGTFIRITRTAVRASAARELRSAAHRKRPGSEHGDVEETSSKRQRDSADGDSAGPSTAHTVPAVTDGTTSGTKPTRNALDIDNLFEVNSELVDVAGRWRNIGLALHLKDPKLSIIQDNNSDVTTRLTDMLRQWLNKTYDVEQFGQPSWQMLAEAVRSPAGGNNPALAAQIEEKHGGQ